MMDRLPMCPESPGIAGSFMFSTPAYDGLYFYDLGGFGNSSGPTGDGIEQTVVTIPGKPRLGGEAGSAIPCFMIAGRGRLQRRS